MIASVSFFGVLWVLLFVAVALGNFIYDTLRGEKLLGEWATKEGCEIIESQRSFFDKGPFMSISRAVVYRVKVSSPDGKIRSGWVRCGGWFFGTSSDDTAVIWD
ncbi:hypothetical protein [Luteolibacter soli]|uniref:DUF3301 domain-containing protein n=1 Tax=Luteolibacter soli TaxID=3135280 RepID=A0ABU9AZZ8_9BACT